MPTPKPTTYGAIIAAARLALAQDLPERDIVKLLRKAAGVTCRNPYKPEGEKLTADLKAYMRDYHARRIASGICTRCGKANDRPGKPSCTTCLNTKKAQQAAR